MILLTRINGDRFALNSDRIERAESTPDTVITLVDGSKYVVMESIEEVMAEVAEFKASILRIAASPDARPPRHQDHLHLVRDPDPESPPTGPRGSGGR